MNYKFTKGLAIFVKICSTILNREKERVSPKVLLGKTPRNGV